MSTIEATELVRAAAQRTEALHTEEIRRILGVPNDDAAMGQLAELITALSNRLLRDLAAGKTPVYASEPDEGLTPAEAARMLGVSRQFVDRMIATGKLACTNKPRSTHRVVAVTDVERFAAERARRRDGVNRAIDALRDGGLEY